MESVSNIIEDALEALDAGNPAGFQDNLRMLRDIGADEEARSLLQAARQHPSYFRDSAAKS